MLCYKCLQIFNWRLAAYLNDDIWAKFLSGANIMYALVMLIIEGFADTIYDSHYHFIVGNLTQCDGVINNPK
jgi:hypothetical protein